MRGFVLLIATFAPIIFAGAQELQSFAMCQECHTDIVQQWKASRHSQSTAETNPFYRAMLNLANKATDGAAGEKCQKCHAPVASLGVTNVTASRLAQEGVTCDVCHATQQSGDWLAIGKENVKYGPYKDPISVVHSGEYSEFLVSSDQCLTCHSTLQTAHGFAFCSTGDEYRQSSFYKKGVTCQDCHMPYVKSKAAELGKIRKLYLHEFYGGYSPEMLHNCAELSVSAEGDSTFIALRVNVRNRTVGHSLPTGSPMRSVYLRLQAFDRDGNVVWRNYINNPIADDPKAVFMRLLENSAGKAPVPPWEAEKVRFDQRLQPDEMRTLEYMLSDVPAVQIKAELLYRLAPPALVQKLKLGDDVYSTPIVIDQKSVNVVGAQ